MKGYSWVLGVVIGLFSASLAVGQATLLPPHKYFGVTAMPGEFTLHHEAMAYIEYVAGISASCKVESYGQTPERRPLKAVFVSSPENLARLSYFQEQQQIRAGLIAGDTLPTKPIVWLSYNVHGDEAAGMEAALVTLHHLLTDATAAKWLEEMIVVIDPCENPDGHDRYVQHYRERATGLPNIHSHAAEHHQPWPGGRYNHYLFDLNRDWVWGTQPETRARIPFYQKYMPHVHVDIHEMGAESPYFFAPAAKPFHEVITPWQRQFQAYVGANNARSFDKNGWLYYTREIYDLLYPSYGDTWPTLNGAIGFTYEQGGSGKAGRALQLQNGSTLTLYDRTQHHYIASIATIETAYLHRYQLLAAHYSYFHAPVEDRYQAYVLSPSPHTADLLHLLRQQNVQFGHPKAVGKTYAAFNYETQRREMRELAPDDVVIPLAQPMSRLVKVLMEPHTYVEDSLTYDLTAWALPYLYQVPAYASEIPLEAKAPYTFAQPTMPATQSQMPYAAILRYKTLTDVQALSRLLDFGFQMRITTAPVRIEGEAFEAGSLLITRADNGHRFVRFDEAIVEALEDMPAAIQWVYTGRVEEGYDLGSERYPLVQPRRIAALYGEGVNPMSYGEVWSFLEQDLQYPFTPILLSELSRIDLTHFDVVIAPSGQYAMPDLLDFVQRGGILIALDDAATQLAHSNQTQTRSSSVVEYSAATIGYDDQERHAISYATAGAIYKVSLDAAHPLALGLGDHTYLLKRNGTAFHARSSKVWPAGQYLPGAHMTGFVGSKLTHHFDNSLAFAAEGYGRGHIVYFPDSPIFRGFWHSGKLLMTNALFFVR